MQKWVIFHFWLKVNVLSMRERESEREKMKWCVGDRLKT